jgi:hypothetical protein
MLRPYNAGGADQLDALAIARAVAPGRGRRHARQGSNLRPLAPEASALSAELRARAVNQVTVAGQVRLEVGA